jgi:signal transduction histidine kinase/CheY-like chemotaxis protein
MIVSPKLILRAALLWAALWTTASAAPSTVLVLHSYDESYYWTRSVTQGIRSVLEQQDVDLRFEYMDLRRFGGEEYLAQLERIYRLKYSAVVPAVVLVSDDRALSFVLERRQRLFQGVPIVFCGINFPENFDFSAAGPVTGIVEIPDLRADLAAIRRLHPGTVRTKLFFGGGTSALVLDAVREAVRGQGELEEFRDVHVAEFINQLRNSDAASLILILDEPEEWPLLPEREREVLMRSQAPVYFLWVTPDTLAMTRGALGVAVVSGREQGVAAARMALSILEGQSPSALPIISHSSHTFYFDYTRLAQFGITEASLPAEAEIFNRPSAFLTSRTGWFWGILVFALVQSALLVALLVTLIQRKRAETERTRLQEELRQAQKMEAVGQLAGGIAHDFNNLLQAILGFADMALAGLKPGEQPHRDLLEVRKAAERAALLTRQLLAFSRRQLLQPSEIEVNQLISDFSKMLRRLIGEHIEYSFIPSPEPLWILADRAMLEQVLLNLAVNARDAMQDGGRLQIRTRRISFNEAFCATQSWARPGRFVEIAVKDTGCGMPPQVLERVFEPFFTTKEQGKGTGLGLAMVYGIIKQHDGLIQVTSHVGRGTEFKLYLPRLEERLLTATEPVREKAPAPPPPRAGTRTILLAEDEEMVRELAVRYLTDHGYRVLAARDGDEAVRLLEESGDSVDLCILDVLMPGRSGLQVVEYLRRVRPEMRILLSSGYSEGTLPELGDRLHLIEKPYTPQALLEQVSRMLG